MVSTRSATDANITTTKTANTMFRQDGSGIDDIASGTSSRRSNSPKKPPRFTIDLSLPPEQRYVEVCKTFQEKMLNLTSLFDEVVGDMVSFIPIGWLHFLCKLFLRRVYDQEENAELQGISKSTGVRMYLLVCFNVLLDLFMGCSSGGAAVQADGDASESKMVHFRTLDWGMPSLRRVVVQLDFVLDAGGPIIASSITYAGFVGVLTGVRKDLSVSLNFRPNRIDNGRFWPNVKYGWHLLMVLLGWRRSISSLLRTFLLPNAKRLSTMPMRSKTSNEGHTISYSDIISIISGKPGQSMPITTTACYLCLCDGQKTTTIEKDRVSAVVHASDEFIVVTNSDEDSSANSHDDSTKEGAQSPAVASVDVELQEVIAEAKERSECARRNWETLESARERKGSGSNARIHCKVDDVVELVQKYPTTNECTHFACVMDPTIGEFAWSRSWPKPVSANWIREHMSDSLT